jgi:hypothetical protein
MRLFLYITIVLVGSSICFANSAPVISELTITPKSNGIFEISYRLIDEDNDRCSISVSVSIDDGVTWSITPSASCLSGDLTNVYPGYRKITWDSKIDMSGQYRTQCRIRLIADDNKGTASPSIAWVYINDSGAGMKDYYGNPINKGGFTGYMSKYETTNAQYAQYLNAAKASGAVTVSGNYVVGTSGPYSGQNYYQLDGTGWTYDGATNGGAARINWTGSSFTVDSGFENHPVTYVSWYGATAFASYYGWRLPTEWEWQAVADHNGSFTYGCGTTINNSIANFYGSYHPHGTTVVANFGTYGYGMADMAGNVGEWTSSGTGNSRVTRGGCWNDNAYHCNVIDPFYMSPIFIDEYTGFRVCR